jgi:glycosidase
MSSLQSARDRTLTRCPTGSVWEYDSASDEYYLHLYLSKQPDLNWENPEVRQAVWDLMMFWVTRGCDGFRVRLSILLRYFFFPR